MKDHAKHIIAMHHSEKDEDRIKDMERESAPLFLLVVLIALATICVIVYDDYLMRAERELLEVTIQRLQRGSIEAVGTDAVMSCTSRRVIGEGL